MTILWQDEGGLPPTGSASTISALLVTTQSIGKRRIAAVASGTTADGSGSTQAGYRQHIGAAVTALQDCLVCARRAVLATTGAILRVSTRRERVCGNPARLTWVFVLRKVLSRNCAVTVSKSSSVQHANGIGLTGCYLCRRLSTAEQIACVECCPWMKQCP